jgi:uncharacterized protein YdcH (DUF465 family)
MGMGAGSGVGAGVGMGMGAGMGAGAGMGLGPSGAINGSLHGPVTGHGISPTGPLTVSVGPSAGASVSLPGPSPSMVPGSTPSSSTFLLGNSDKDKASAFGRLFHYVNEMKKELENAQKQRREGQLETQRLREKCQQLDDRLAVEHSKSAGLEDRLERAKATQRTLRSQVPCMLSSRYRTE